MNADGAMLAASHSTAIVARIASADCAGVRIYVTRGAIIVALGAVRIRSDVGLHIRTGARCVALDTVAARVRARTIILRVCGASDHRRGRSNKNRLHSILA
jgi:hypothetical protein